VRAEKINTRFTNLNENEKIIYADHQNSDSNCFT